MCAVGCEERLAGTHIGLESLQGGPEEHGKGQAGKQEVELLEIPLTSALFISSMYKC